MAKNFRLFKPFRYCDCHKYSENNESAQTWNFILCYLEILRYSILFYFHINKYTGGNIEPLLNESGIPGLMEMCNSKLNPNEPDLCETLVTTTFVASFVLACLKAVLWNFSINAITVAVRNEICPPSILYTSREDFEMHFHNYFYYATSYLSFYAPMIGVSWDQLSRNYNRFYSKTLPSFLMALEENRSLIEQLRTLPICFPVSLVFNDFQHDHTVIQ